MKASRGFTQLWPSVAVAVAFLVGAVFLTIAVRSEMVSTTLVLGLGMEAMGAVVLGVFVMGERLTLSQTSGIALVIAGVALLRA